MEINQTRDVKLSTKIKNISGIPTTFIDIDGNFRPATLYFIPRIFL